MAFDPTFDRVVIERDPSESVSKGGILIPDMAQEKAGKGIVRAVGPGRWTGATDKDGKPTRFPLTVSVGDRVMFQPHDGTEFKTDEEKPRTMIVVNEGSILGIL